MYVFPDMIDMGLMNDQSWPSDNHRSVAARIALCNPNVTDRDKLTEVTQAVMKVPKGRIKLIDYSTLVKEFNMPDVGMFE